jgi:hypothetical protein
MTNDQHFEHLTWQQDGDAPHYGCDICTFLNATFTVWIGCRGAVEWPPRLLDLTPCDYSMWGIIKDVVYAQKQRDVEHMEALIDTEFVELHMNKDLCSAVCHSVLKEAFHVFSMMMDTLNSSCSNLHSSLISF